MAKRVEKIKDYEDYINEVFKRTENWATNKDILYDGDHDNPHLNTTLGLTKSLTAKTFVNRGYLEVDPDTAELSSAKIKYRRIPTEDDIETIVLNIKNEVSLHNINIEFKNKFTSKFLEKEFGDDAKDLFDESTALYNKWLVGTDYEKRIEKTFEENKKLCDAYYHPSEDNQIEEELTTTDEAPVVDKVDVPKEERYDVLHGLMTMNINKQDEIIFGISNLISELDQLSAKVNDLEEKLDELMMNKTLNSEV